jgi:BlaI family transcriptional regulator, penicillinase repressor
VTLSNTHKPLTALQQEILDFIWSSGPVTVDQVRQHLSRKHPLKDSSVRTLLRRLEKRGYLTHRVNGNTFLYRARVRPQSVAARAVRHIIDKLCAGSTEQFLTGLVDEEILSVEEIERLAKKVRNQK